MVQSLYHGTHVSSFQRVLWAVDQLLATVGTRSPPMLGRARPGRVFCLIGGAPQCSETYFSLEKL